MPPAQIVLTVTASLAIEKDGNNRAPFELLFDSTAQPLPAGVRSSLIGVRQVLYRIGSVYVDMEFDRQGNSQRWLLVGQMLDSARPGRPLTKVPISLVERGRNVTRTQSNDNGEFRLEFEARSDLKLELWIDRRHPVYLPITVAQDRIQPTSAGKQRKASAGVGDSLAAEAT
jgi:hypothetical protein